MLDKGVNNSGIYKIINIITNEFYIGSSRNFKVRFGVHKNQLNKNTHCNLHLQRSWNKYGESCFKFEIILNCNSEFLIDCEQWYIDNIKPEFNICKVAGSFEGYKHTNESRKKLSKLKKLYKFTEEHKLNISKSKKGKMPSEYVIRKMREGIKNRVFTKEYREKLRNGRLGYKMSNESKMKLSKSKTGMPANNRLKVINSKTGVIYESITDASLKNNITYSVLARKLRGERKNNTDFLLILK